MTYIDLTTSHLLLVYQLIFIIKKNTWLMRIVLTIGLVQKIGILMRLLGMITILSYQRLEIIFDNLAYFAIT